MAQIAWHDAMIMRRHRRTGQWTPATVRRWDATTSRWELVEWPIHFTSVPRWKDVNKNHPSWDDATTGFTWQEVLDNG